MSDRARGAAIVGERGAILPLMAILVFVLMGAAAMAIDLGWLFWQSIEVQHGADAASLAGVVYEPDFRTEAHDEAIAAAAQNGYDDSSPGTTVTVIDFVDDPTAVSDDSELKATISHEIPTLFFQVFGMDSVTISRTATARYVLPLPLGSPFSYFGDDLELGNTPGFWGNIHGTYAARSNGDRYSSLCLNDGIGSSCSPDNSGEWRLSSGEGTTAAQGGYLYGIAVPEGATGLSVEIFDGPYNDISDHKSNPFAKLSGDGSQTPATSDLITWFMLYGPDPTPLDTTDGNELLCSIRYTHTDSRSEDYPGWNDTWGQWTAVTASMIADLWDDMATSAYKEPGCAASFDRGPGIYPLRVLIEHSDTETGLNHYTLRTSTTGPAANIYALGDMSIWSNGGDIDTTLYLAEVDQRYAGEDLIIELQDVGDTNGDAADEFSIVDGDDLVVDCEWVATDDSPIGLPNPTSGGPGPCTVVAGGKIYNDEVMTFTIHLAEDYTCTGDACWFKFVYDYSSSSVKDSTTWDVYIDGNPIRLVS